MVHGCSHVMLCVTDLKPALGWRCEVPSGRDDDPPELDRPGITAPCREAS